MRWPRASAWGQGLFPETKTEVSLAGLCTFTSPFRTMGGSPGTLLQTYSSTLELRGRDPGCPQVLCEQLVWEVGGIPA